MPEGMFSRVKLERKTAPKKAVAANGEQFRDLGDETIPFKTNEGIQKCIAFRVCERCLTFHFIAERCPSWKHCGVGRNKIRTFEILEMEQPMIKLDVNN